MGLSVDAHSALPMRSAKLRHDPHLPLHVPCGDYQIGVEPASTAAAGRTAHETERVRRTHRCRQTRGQARAGLAAECHADQDVVCGFHLGFG